MHMVLANPNCYAGQACKREACHTHQEGWPEPYIHTVYDRIFGDFPAKNTVYTPYIYGSGQLYTSAKLSRSCGRAH